MGVAVKVKIKVKSNLGEILSERGLIKKWVAGQIECTQPQLNKWCRNDDDGQALSTPSVGYLLRLKKLLNVDIEDMFEEIKED